jgi:prevent-host-death family protein
MNVSTKELRIQPGRIIDQVVNGEEITVTFRGKALAKIIPISEVDSDLADQEDSIFGMWNSHDQKENVDAMVREMRQGRQF